MHVAGIYFASQPLASTAARALNRVSVGLCNLTH